MISMEERVSEAADLYRKTKSRMKDGNFNLRKWNSNSRELTELIKKEEQVDKDIPKVSEEDETYARTNLGDKIVMETTERKVLGLIWNHFEDHFIFEFNFLIQFARELPLSKRSVLKVVAKLYDPLGLLSPLFTTIKVIFQELCKLKVDWDEPLTDNLKSRYLDWLIDLESVESFSIERCYFHGMDGDVISVQIHGFGDSSEAAYAAVVYLRIETTTSVYVKLVMSKARVAPLARQTVPRLELLAALILARLVSRVQAALEPIVNVDDIFCWTDSMTTLCWIQGVDKEFKQFVENRVKEIRNKVSREHWNHCPGKDNPADIPSRGSRADLLKQSKKWWNGPMWLIEERGNWPTTQETTNFPEGYLDEIKASDRSLQGLNPSASFVVQNNPTQSAGVSSIIHMQRYSSFGKLIRVTVYVLRFLRNLRAKGDERMYESVSIEEYKEAEKLWLIQMQESVRKSPKFKELTQQLGLYEDEIKLLRCKGRLQNATIPVDARHPIILPQGHYLTELIIRDCHQRVLHNGVKETLTELRTRFWVARGRQIIRKIVSKCVKCKRLEGKHYALPKTAPLPKFRVEENPAFMNTGIDFAGPLYVKTSTAKESHDTSKVYIALYTCGSSRAVHLDVVPDLNAGTFIRSFKRFIGRRGIPRLVVTDNAKTFKSASRTLSTVFKLPAVQKFLLDHRITWRFNLERAPWWGGFFERLIRCVKRCLKKILRNARLTYEELLTVVVDIECVLNSRPLTFVHSEDMEEPLTPSHLMLGRRIRSIPDDIVIEEEKENEVVILSRRHRYISVILSHFWNRWKREYVVELREHHREPRINYKNLSHVQVGDIVTVLEEGKSNRTTWKLGRVKSLHPGRDGCVRGATVDVSSNGKRVTLRRPLAKLFPLEVQDINDEDKDVVVNSSSERQKESRRKAAEEGELRRRVINQRCEELDVMLDH